jgi:hypothetical protein
VGAGSRAGAGVTGLGNLFGLSSLRGSEDELASRLRPCIAELMESSRKPVIHLGKGKTGIDFERNDMTRASVSGASCGLWCLNGFPNAGFEKDGKMGLPLAVGACPDPSRVLAVIKFLALDTPLGIALVSPLAVKDFCLAICNPVLLVFVVDFVCRGIRPGAAAGLGRVEVIVVWGRTPGPTLAENEVMDLPRGGEALMEVDALKRGIPAVAAIATA